MQAGFLTFPGLTQHFSFEGISPHYLVKTYSIFCFQYPAMECLLHSYTMVTSQPHIFVIHHKYLHKRKISGQVNFMRLDNRPAYNIWFIKFCTRTIFQGHVTVFEATLLQLYSELSLSPLNIKLHPLLLFTEANYKFQYAQITVFGIMQQSSYTY